MDGSKKNILILPRWYPNRKDIQLGVFIRNQALLIRKDYTVFVIYVQADPDASQEFELVQNKEDGIFEQIVYFKAATGISRKFVNSRRYKKAQYLAFANITSDIDRCHVHVPYRSAFLALELNRKGIPFFITEHWSGHLTGEYKKKNSMDQALYRKVLEKAKGISVVSHLLRQKLKENTGFDSVVIPNYIQNIPLKERQTSDLIHLLSVSDFADNIKNISGLISAFKAAYEKNDKLRLTLIGGGPDEKYIRELVAESGLADNILHLAGRRSHEDVLRAMQECDFYVCNSNFETFGMTAAEALMAGKPVVSTRCGGPEEFLDESNSILVQPRNNDELTLALLEMAVICRNFDAKQLSHQTGQRFGKETVLKMWKTFYDNQNE